MSPAAGDTRPTKTLVDLAKDTDVLVLQNMGPIADVSALSFQSQLLINVSACGLRTCWWHATSVNAAAYVLLAV